MAPASPLSSESRADMSSSESSKSKTSAFEITRSGCDDFGSGMNLYR